MLKNTTKSTIEMEVRKEDVKMDKIYFAKVKENAIIPTKRDGDAGRDLYACFDEDYMIIPPLETKLIPTGIATAFNESYYAQIQERGSTGSKGIKYGAGVIDSSYRGQWFIAITNCNDKDLVIIKDGVEFDRTDCILYPYDKGIAQFVMLEVPKFKEETITYEELQQFKSERGNGALGSSGK